MIKSTVILSGIKPEMTIVDNITRLIFFKHNYGCVITSGLDSHEGRVSFHNEGFALDYRTKHISNEAVKDQILEECKFALPQCDVGIHSRGTSNEHLHIEFDPKGDFEFQAKKKRWLAGEENVW